MKHKKLKILYVLIPIIIIIAIFLIFKDYTKDISKTYEGILVDAQGTDFQKVTVHINGDVTYDSVFSDNVAAYYLDFILKDEAGNTVLETYSGCDVFDDVDFSFSWEMEVLCQFYPEDGTVDHMGLFFCDKDFKQFLLKFEDGRYCAAPATSLNEAQNLYNNNFSN